MAWFEQLTQHSGNLHPMAGQRKEEVSLGRAVRVAMSRMRSCVGG